MTIAVFVDRGGWVEVEVNVEVEVERDEEEVDEDELLEGLMAEA